MVVEFLQKNRAGLFIGLLAASFIFLFADIDDGTALTMIIVAGLIGIIVANNMDIILQDNRVLGAIFLVTILTLFIGQQTDLFAVGAIGKVASKAVGGLDDLVKNLFKTTTKTAAKPVTKLSSKLPILTKLKTALFGKGTKLAEVGILGVIGAGLTLISPILAIATLLLGIIFIGMPIGSLINTITANIMPILIIAAIILVLLAVLRRQPMRTMRVRG